MNLLRFFTALVLFLIFFVWALAGNFNLLYIHYIPSIFFVLFPVLFLFSIPGIPERIKKTFPFFEKYAFVIFPLMGFGIALYINLFVFYGIPRVQDEINMKFMAEAILNGKLSAELHPHYEFFRYLYIIPSLNGTYSIYQPGFPLLLAPFLFFKVPFLLNPVLTGGVIYFLGKITTDFYNKKVAALTMFFAATSVFILSMGGTLMPHSLCAFATLAAFYFCNRSLSGNFYRNNIFSLLFLVSIMFTRPQNGIFVLIPLILLVFVKTDLKLAVKYTVFAFFFILPFLFLLYYSDSVFSGEFGTPKHVSYFQYTEPENDCMGIGLNKGCRFATLQELPEEGFTLSFAFYITSLRLVQFVFFLFFHPVMMLFMIILFLFRSKKEELIKDFLLLSVFMVTFIAYFFYYFDGNVYGPRYYYEVAFFLIPLTAKGFLRVWEKFPSTFNNPLLNTSNILIIIVMTGLLFQFLFSVPVLNKIHRAAFWGSDPLLKKVVEEKGIDNAVVFINPEEYYSSGAAIMNMALIDKNDVIYALDFGDVSNRRLMDYYPDRAFYRATFNKKWYEMVPPELKEVPRQTSTDKIVVRMYEKSYPIGGVPDYCGTYPVRESIDRYAGFEIPSEVIGGRKVFFCRFTDSSQFYTFGQKFVTEGMYKVKIIGLTNQRGGKFEVISGSIFKEIDFKSEKTDYTKFEAEFYFQKGFNLITFRPSSAVSSQGEYFIIDSIVFERLDR